MRNRKPQSIASVIESLLRHKKGWKSGLQEAQIHERWVEIVGAELAERARPGKLFRGKLDIHCDHDVWRTELVYLKPQILKRIRQVVGRDAVKEVFLR